MGEEMITVRLAGAITQGAAIDTRASGVLVTVPREKLDADDLVFRVDDAALRAFGMQRGDLLIVEPRPEGNAATAELVLATLRERAFIGRWWTKRGQRALLDDAYGVICDDRDLQVIGTITVIVRGMYGGGMTE